MDELKKKFSKTTNLFEPINIKVSHAYMSSSKIEFQAQYLSTF
jgi:hypothetical protein